MDQLATRVATKPRTRFPASVVSAKNAVTAGDRIAITFVWAIAVVMTVLWAAALVAIVRWVF